MICVLSYQHGDLSKLIYGTDSHGFICGKSYSFMGTTLDLSNKKSLYYLDPLQLLSTTTLPYANSICVDSCPSVDVCSLTSLPCTNANAFKWVEMVAQVSSDIPTGAGDPAPRDKLHGQD